jgi:hypothetical protein
MKRGCLIVLAVPVIVVFGLWVSWPLLYPTYTVRYRLTVNAIVKGIPHSGSSVIELRVKTQPQFIAEVPPWLFYISGEAAFVDLGDSRNLVAVLAPVGQDQNARATKPPYRGSVAYQLPFKAFKVRAVVEHAKELRNLEGERRLEQKDWPSFVTFRDVNDPFSVESVDLNDLARTLGDGARIESVTVAITQEPVTHGLQQSLPWLGTQLSLQDIYALAKRQISVGAFVRDDQR